jgi:hypothetical protein
MWLLCAISGDIRVELPGALFGPVQGRAMALSCTLPSFADPKRFCLQEVANNVITGDGCQPLSGGGIGSSAELILANRLANLDVVFGIKQLPSEMLCLQVIGLIAPGERRFHRFKFHDGYTLIVLGDIGFYCDKTGSLSRKGSNLMCPPFVFLAKFRPQA